MAFTKVVHLFTVTHAVSALVIVAYVLLVSTHYHRQIYLIRNSFLQYSQHVTSQQSTRSSHKERIWDIHSITDNADSRSERYILSLIPDFSEKREGGISELLQLGKPPTSSKSSVHFLPRLTAVNSTQCSDKLCTNHLSQEDRVKYSQCTESVHAKTSTPPQKADCHFVKGSGRSPVALVSLPGSGNTWVRQLLEAATGVCTGGIYCDISLRAKGFAGEFVNGSSVLVVKTHEDYPVWSRSGGSSVATDVRETLSRSGEGKLFGAAIFLVRNPLDALVAEWNRNVANDFNPKTVTWGSHIERAGMEWFGKNTKWNEFVYEQSNRWKAMVKNWVLLNEHQPVLVVKYESLLKDPLAELQRMVDFLNIDSIRTLQRSDIEDFSAFRRNHTQRYKNFHPFTLKQRQYVLSCVNGVLKNVEKHGLTSVMNIKDYLYVSQM